jgi:hypothetical protein
LGNKTGKDAAGCRALTVILLYQGIIRHKGSIIDATFVTVPKRHTTKKDDGHLKDGEELELNLRR